MDTEDWKLLHSRPCVVRQEDTFNCGLHSILNAVALHHKINTSSVLSTLCNRLRVHLTLFFTSLDREQQRIHRLCPQWDIAFPLSPSTDDNASNSNPLDNNPNIPPTPSASQTSEAATEVSTAPPKQPASQPPANPASQTSEVATEDGSSMSEPPVSQPPVNPVTQTSEVEGDNTTTQLQPHASQTLLRPGDVDGGFVQLQPGDNRALTAHIAGQLLQSGAITGNTTLRYELHDNGDGLPPTLTVSQRPMSPLPPPVPNTVSSGGQNVGGDGGGHGEDRDEKNNDNEQDSAGSDDDEETGGESKRDQGSENNDDSNDQDEDNGNVQGNQNSSDDGDSDSDDDKEQGNAGDQGSSEDDSDEDDDDDDEDYQEPKKPKARKKIASSSEDEDDDDDDDEEDEQDTKHDNSKKPRLKFSVPRKDPPDAKRTVSQSAKRKKGTVVGPEKEPRNKELPIRPLDNHLLDVLSNTPQNGFRTHRQKMWVVIKARKKRDPNFRWPNPENNTEEEDKRIERELESEVAGLQRRIDDKVEKLVQKHFKGMMKGRSQTLKDTQETRDVQSKGNAASLQGTGSH